MATLRSPSGSIIQATGRLEQRLLDQGWKATDQPAAPGLALVTAADLNPLANDVDQLSRTVEAPTTQQAPRPTPRTDALEAWRNTVDKTLAALRTDLNALAAKLPPGLAKP
jgi:hypothetical protein